MLATAGRGLTINLLEVEVRRAEANQGPATELEADPEPVEAERGLAACRARAE